MKEKALLKRVVALICCVAVLTTTLVLTVFAAPARKVVRVGLKADEGIILWSDDSENLRMPESFGTNYYVGQENEEGDYVIPEGYDSILTEMNDGTLSGKEVKFYAEVPTGKSVKIDGATNVTVELDEEFETTTQWKVLIKKVAANNDDSTVMQLTLSLVEAPKSQYTVTFPPHSTDYDIVIDGKALDEDSKTYVEGTEVSFTVQMKNAAKEVTFSIGRTTLNPNNEGGYSFTVAKDTTISATVTDKTYTVTGPEGGNYIYSPVSDSTTVTHGGTFRFEVYPADGFEKPTVKATGGTLQQIPSSNTYVISNITSDVTITVEDGSSKTYDVSYVADSLFEIKDLAATVKHGGTVTFTVETKTGYVVSTVRANGKLVNVTDGKYSIANVTADLEIVVTVTKASYDITYPAGSNDAYTLVQGAASAEYGSSYNFTVVPTAGYNAPVVRVNGSLVTPDANNQYTFTVLGPTAITIDAGSKQEFQITVSNGEGYTIKVDPSKVNYNGTALVTVKVEDDYNAPELKLFVNGAEVAGNKVAGGETFTYEITNITANVTVSVTGVQRSVYNVTLMPGAGYTLTALDDVNVSSGDDFRFSLALNDGYVRTEGFKVLAGDQEISTDREQINFTVKITGKTDIKVVGIELQKFTVDLTDVMSDNVTFSGANEVTYGETYTFTITANPGYSVVVVANNGEVLSSVGGKYTISNVTSAPVILVETHANTLTVHYESTVENHPYTETKPFVWDTVEKVLDETISTHVYHKHTGWLYNGRDVDAEELQALIKDADAEITLTAVFEMDKAAVLEQIKLSATVRTVLGNASTTGYKNLRYTANILISEDALNDPCLTEHVKVTAHGTFFTNNKTVLNNTAALESAWNVIDKPASGDMLTIDGKSVLINYKDCDLTLASVNGKCTSMTAVVSEASMDKRYAVGWIEITIDGVSMIIFSTPYGVVAQ